MIPTLLVLTSANKTPLSTLTSPENVAAAKVVGVMLAEPSKLTPPIVLAFAKAVAVEARVTVVPAITELKAVLLTVIASASKVPSISTSPDISSSVATILSLKVAAPAALPSIVKNVVSEPPSVPLKIMSESFACASNVILPDVVAIVTAASPVEISSAALLLALASVNSCFEGAYLLNIVSQQQLL